MNTPSKDLDTLPSFESILAQRGPGIDLDDEVRRWLNQKADLMEDPEVED